MHWTSIVLARIKKKILHPNSWTIFFFLNTTFKCRKLSQVMKAIFKEKSGHKKDCMYLQVYDQVGGFSCEAVISKLLFFSKIVYNPLCTALIWKSSSVFVANTFYIFLLQWTQEALPINWRFSFKSYWFIFPFLPASCHHFKISESWTRVLVLNEYIWQELSLLGIAIGFPHLGMWRLRVFFDTSSRGCEHSNFQGIRSVSIRKNQQK